MLRKLQMVSLGLISLTAAPAVAQPVVPPTQQAPIIITRRLPPSSDLLMRVVNIGDLNLASAAGQQEMEKRVAKAVDDMCAIPAPLPSYKGAMEKPCRDEAWESARWQMKDAAQRAGSGS